jgi:hypothetical protein
LVLGAVEEIGSGPNRQRSGTSATGALQNVAITASTAGIVTAASAAALASGSPVLIGGATVTAFVILEGLKRSKPFTATTAWVTKGLDKVSETEVLHTLEDIVQRLVPQLKFVLAAEPQLRRLAGQGQQFAWVNQSLDWIKQRNVMDKPAGELNAKQQHEEPD